jgi:hypothetical protein
MRVPPWSMGPSMVYEYRCVSGPVIVAVKSARARDQAVKAFEDIMNAEAASGWEFVGIDEFHISEPEGFLSRKRVFVPAKILVFRREKADSAMATALKARQERGAPERVEDKPALPKVAETRVEPVFDAGPKDSAPAKT